MDHLRPLAAEVISQAKDLASHGMPQLRYLFPRLWPEAEANSL